MADVNMGLNVYEFNKNIMKQLPIIEDLKSIRETLINYLHETSAKNYLMMLSKDNDDFVLFHFNNKNKTNNQFDQDIIECMENRGYGIISCEKTEDKIAIELWVKEPGQMEDAKLYYIFPADQIVIEY